MFAPAPTDPLIDAAADQGLLCTGDVAETSVGDLWRRIGVRGRMTSAKPGVALTPEIERAIASGAAVAVGVSGGKDGAAAAIATLRHLDAVGHAGPRVLVHSDLGRIEWSESLPECERLAASLGTELLVVRRAAGDMIARWEGRWRANLARYVELESVRLILPWSTPQMRFCTSELKTDVIASALKRRFPEHDIVNATGIRRQESTARARMPVAAPMAKLARRGLVGYSWNPIIEWQVEDVLQAIHDNGAGLHEAYTRYGTSRVSCIACIMSARGDLHASMTCESNAPAYRLLVDLEARSTFAFQGSYWLADVAPHLLDAPTIEAVRQAKAFAKERQALEALIPKHLLFTAVKGKPVPQALPTPAEAKMLADVRRAILPMFGAPLRHVDPDAVVGRYAQLIAAHDAARPLLARAGIGAAPAAVENPPESMAFSEMDEHAEADGDRIAGPAR